MDRQVIHAYRHLYRHGLRAVQFSKPARYAVRDMLRYGFRHEGRPQQEQQQQLFDQDRIDNTLAFLRAATACTGLEHKVLKNLCQLWRSQPLTRAPQRNGRRPVGTEENAIKATAYDHYSYTIRMLNESMGMCLPIKSDPYAFD